MNNRLIDFNHSAKQNGFETRIIIYIYACLHIFGGQRNGFLMVKILFNSNFVHVFHGINNLILKLGGGVLYVCAFVHRSVRACVRL